MEDKHVTEMFTWLYESDNPHKKHVSRNETGHSNLRNADYIQKYNWKFFFDSTNGEGEFMWFIHPRKHIYGSSISINGKEGYGRMSYPCGSYFEGLLLNNERFGPGVYTNSAGEQDVGIWLGNKLVRLIRSLPEIKILQIAREKEDKIKILKYRTIISLNEDHWQNIVKNLINNNTSDLDRVNINLWKRLNELCRPIPNDRRSLWYHVLDNEYMQKYFHEEKESTTELSTMDMKVTKAIPNSHNTRQSYSSASEVKNKEDTLREKKQSNDERVKIEESNAKLFTDQYQEESMNVDDESSEDEFYCGIKGFSEKDQMGNFEDKWHIFANLNNDDFPSIDNTINYSEGRKSQNSTLNFEEFDRIEAILEFPTEVTFMTHLLAWNNNQAMIDILKHVFRHRNDEKKLRYNIHNILAGKRGEFRTEGAHEMAALNFLIASSNGFKNAIREIILKENLDVNLADNGGNTGLIYAAASNRLEAIDTLLDLGADINCINDECSTPLSLCILRLLESVHGVVDRAKAFLPRNIESINLKQSDFLTNDNNVPPNLQQWCPRNMFPYEQIPIKIHEQKDDYSISRNTNNGSKETKRSNIGRDVIHHIESCWKLQNGNNKNNMKFYQSIKQIKKILDTHGDLPVSSNINLEETKENELPSSSHAKQSDKKLPVSSEKYEIQNYIFDWNPITEVSSNKENERRKLREINRNIEKETQTYNTILKLLSRGANPNYPTAPYPVLIMAIFSKSTNLVQQLLLYGADPNVTLSKQEYSLAPLHILAVIEPSSDNSIIAKSLIHANADVNLRTDSTYRPDVKARVSEGRSTEFLDDSEGFTALHLLALRSDYKTDTNQFLTQLVCALLCNGSNKSHKFYQGHSALSLAIIEENIDAMKLLLETGQINVNEQLGFDLGSCMLMMVSRRLQEKLPASFIEESIQLLLNFGGCPLTRCKMISRDYNQLEYAREELHSLMHKSSENVSDNKFDNKLKEHEEKESLMAINKYFVEIINLLENVARNLMKRQICGKIVRKMVNFHSYIDIDVIRTKSRLDKLMKFASSWMNATELAFTMSIMKYGEEDIKKVLIAYLGSNLQRISTSNNTIDDNAQQIILGISDNDKTVITNDECTQYSERHVIHPPETDPDVKKFMVCFECFMMHNKVLIWCPICRLVLFCSQTCNINNIRRAQNPHTCKAFYNEELEKLERIANSIGVNPREFLRDYMLKSAKDGNVKKMHKYKRSIPKKTNSLKKWKPHEYSIMPEWKQTMLNACNIRKPNVKNEVKDMELGNCDEVKASEEDNLPIFTDKEHYLDNTNFYCTNLENNMSQINKIANEASSLKSPTVDAKQELRDKKRIAKSLNANSKYSADYCNDVERMCKRGKRYYATGDRTHRTSIESETRGKFKISDTFIKKLQKANDKYKRNEKLGDDEEKIVQEVCRLKNIQDNKVSCVNKNVKSSLGRLVNSKNENVLDKGKKKGRISQNNKYSNMEEKHAHRRSKKEMISDKNRYTCNTVIDYELKKRNQQNKKLSSGNKEERQLLQNDERLYSIKKYKINSNNAFTTSAVWLLNCDEFVKELNSKTFTLSYIAFSNGDIYYSNKETDEDTKPIDNYSLL